MEFFSRVQTQPFEGIISCPLSFLVWPSPSYWSLSLTLVPPLPSLCSSSLPLLLPFTLLPLPHSALSPLLCSYPLFCIFSLTSFPLPLPHSVSTTFLYSFPCLSSFSPSHCAPSLLLCSHLLPLIPLPAFFLPPSVSNVVYSASHPITQTVYISVCLTVWLAAGMSVILYLYFGMYNTTWQPSLSAA